MPSTVCENYELYQAGKPFYSPAPQRLVNLPDDVGDRLRGWFLDQPYSLGVSQERKKELYVLQPALQAASQIILLSADDHEPELRLGLFSAAAQWLDDTELHIDDGPPGGLILCVVGEPTNVWVGDAVRLKRHPHHFKNRIKPLEGEMRQLESGYIYRLAPTTAHAEPVAPGEPQMRYFWRAAQQV